MFGLLASGIAFPREGLQAALWVSLLSVWVLVGLFYYLNRYTQRRYFAIWTAAWLFYALWLTLGITVPDASPTSVVQVFRNWCVSLSAVALLWGSLAFLEIQVRQVLLGLFMAFLLVWDLVGMQVVGDPLRAQFPVFLLIGVASIFAAASFYRHRERRRFVGVGMLCLGFTLWGIYLVAYPFSQARDSLLVSGFFFSAGVQLFIAVSMIVLVIEETRHLNIQALAQIQAAEAEKQSLETEILLKEPQGRSLYEAAELREELQEAFDGLIQTQQTVVQQERLRALRQMSSSLAHQINNALSPISAFSALLLKKEAGLSLESRQNVEHIQSSANEIADMVTRMGEFYRPRNNGEYHRMEDVNALAQQVIEATESRWRDSAHRNGSSIKVETDLEECLPELYCCGRELREAVTNLLLNSVEALPSGGRIRLRTRILNPSPLGESPSLLVEVSDNGVGMDESTRQRCLEPFFSTKKPGGGTGLGLAVVYGVIERHEGQMEVHSRLRRGTSVRLLLPLRQPPAPKAAAPALAASDAGPLRILCIDDEPLLRELLKQLLDFHEHEVETADGGQSGLTSFFTARDKGQPFDVVITDLGMPGVDGREVVEQIKSSSPDTGVILLTGWGNMLDGTNEAALSRVDALVSKPPRWDELNATLARVAAKTRSRNTSPETAAVAC